MLHIFHEIQFLFVDFFYSGISLTACLLNTISNSNFYFKFQPAYT